MAAAQKLLTRVGQIGIGFAIAGGVAQSALYNVDGGQRAVIFDRFAGVKPDVVGEGTHFLIPWVQRPIIFDIRSTPRVVTTITGSKDLQNVSITLRILHRPEPSKLPNIYLNIGQDYAERVLPSITNEILKAVVAQFDAHEMITQRESVSNRVSVELQKRAQQFGFLLDDISIRPIIFDIRSTPRVVTTITGSKDLQNVSITLRILHRPEPSKLPNIYLNIGQDYAERVLPSITNEILKAVVAQFDAHEMITQRESVSNRVSVELQKRAQQFGFLLDDISITHLSFGREFTEAVEMKQVAQQEAEKARYLVEKAEQMKMAAITTAEGDAQASKLLAKAFSEAGDGLIELRKIEAAEEIAERLSKAKNVTYLPHDINPLLQLPQ
uniref:Band 7 domain-containing protein n=1 Tax=Panagrolaimus sp. JU765 TaxID=591449 RepID=A0AC34QER1_9BILA